MASQLITCPACECHAKSSETSCPHCGAALRREDNSRFPRSATAVALGLSAVLTAVGCDEPVASPVYGVAVTGGAGGMGTGGEGGMAGHGGHGGKGGQGGMAGMGGMGGGGQGGAGGQGGK